MVAAGTSNVLPDGRYPLVDVCSEFIEDGILVEGSIVSLYRAFGHFATKVAQVNRRWRQRFRPGPA